MPVYTTHGVYIFPPFMLLDELPFLAWEVRWEPAKLPTENLPQKQDLLGLVANREPHGAIPYFLLLPKHERPTVQPCTVQISSILI